MPIDGQLRKAATLCLAILQRYQDADRSAEARALMVAELEVIAGWLLELNLPASLVAEFLLSPVETELCSRYGSTLGQRLTKDFFAIFEKTNIL